MFKKFFGITISLLILLSLSIRLNAGTAPAIMGAYSILEGEKFKFDGKTVEIVEFMSFYCDTCYNFESAIPEIKNSFPKKIKWKSLPIYWSGHGSPRPTEAYFLAEDAGKGEEMKKALFEAQMVQKIDIADVNVIEGIANKIGLGPEFGKKLRQGVKAAEAKKAVDLAVKYMINETPTLIIAGNIRTDPHLMNHDLNAFKMNAIVIIASILKK